MLRYSAPNAFNPFGSLRPCAQPAVEPTAAVPHRGTLAGSTPPIAGSAAFGVREIAWRIAVPQLAVSLVMGCPTNFTHSPRLPLLLASSLRQPQPEGSALARGYRATYPQRERTRSLEVSDELSAHDAKVLPSSELARSRRHSPGRSLGLGFGSVI